MSLQRTDTKFYAASVDSLTGAFSGYGAVFGNVDSYADVILPGSFKTTLETWRAKRRWPAMKLMHGAAANPFADDLPIGVWSELKEDSHGLWVEGKLLALNTDFGRRILSLMAGGALTGLSIGYKVRRSSPGRGTTKRWIEAVDLFEVSVVDEPANSLARVTHIKERSAYDMAGDRLQAALRMAA